MYHVPRNVLQVIWNIVKLEFWILVALYHMSVLKAMIKITNFSKFQPSHLYWLQLWEMMIQLLLKTMLLNELIELETLHHTSFRKLLTKINVCAFHSLYFWLVLLKGMYKILDNIVEHIPIFFRFSKERFYKVSGNPSYFCLKSFDQSHNFLQFLFYWIALVAFD